MNHGSLFWKTYNILKKDMAKLDAKGYTGEGFYSRPYTLNSTVPFTRPIQENEIPEQLCGGTWRRQIRRRKTGGRKRKFKGEGVKIGADEEKRRQLEHGKVTGSKVFLPKIQVES
jgi:DNA-dependent metalloprotease WSS1